LVRRETTAIQSLPENYRVIVISCFQKAIKLGYSITVAFALTAFVISLFVRNIKLHNRITK
jgi:hypothetical protein